MLVPEGGADEGGMLDRGIDSSDSDDASDPAACVATVDLTKRPVDVLLLLDRSGSMQDIPQGATDPTSKWNLIVPALTDIIAQTNTRIAWGLKVFPEGAALECSPAAVTSAIDVPIASMNSTALAAAMTSTMPQGGGTPTGDAVAQATSYLQSLTGPESKYILLATDGVPSCPVPTDAARSFAVQAVGNAAAAGFHTLVLGVSTTTTSDNSSSDLVAALGAITGTLANCSFSLSSAPPAPNDVTLHVSGAVAPRDRTHTDGWDYVSSDARGIAFYGSFCDLASTPGVTAQLTYACADAAAH